MNESKLARPTCGHCSERGLRRTMEDEVHIVEEFNVDSKHLSGPLGFYAVFDGHGGTKAAEYARDELHKKFVALIEDSEISSVEEALTKAFCTIDDEFVAFAISNKDTSGTTACVVLIEYDTNKVWVANVGDSRCVMSRKGEAVVLSRDHKPAKPDELKRIRKAGGFVIMNRVMGELAVSRAIGDKDYKQEGMKFVIAEPEIETFVLCPEDEFIVIACDGLYDVMANEQVVNHARNCALQGMAAEAVAKDLVDTSISTLYTRDNVSVIFLSFRAPIKEDSSSSAQASDVIIESDAYALAAEYLVTETAVLEEVEEEVEEEMEEEVRSPAGWNDEIDEDIVVNSP